MVLHSNIFSFALWVICPSQDLKIFLTATFVESSCEAVKVSMISERDVLLGKRPGPFAEKTPRKNK